MFWSIITTFRMGFALWLTAVEVASADPVAANDNNTTARIRDAIAEILTNNFDAAGTNMTCRQLSKK
jgi:hypothetical protein